MPPVSVYTGQKIWNADEGATCLVQPISRHAPATNVKPTNFEHFRFYGNDLGDESGELCPLMLQVVLDLFDGVDYEDP